MDKYMKIALKEALVAYEENEIPVGAVIVFDDKVLCKTHNEKEKYKNSLKHAELLAINIASEIKKDWRLNDCDLYVTMEPCLMCIGALIQCRIRNVYYLIDNPKFGGLNNLDLNKYNHKINIYKLENNKLNNYYKKLLQKFFKDKR